MNGHLQPFSQKSNLYRPSINTTETLRSIQQAKRMLFVIPYAAQASLTIGVKYVLNIVTRCFAYLLV